MYLVLLGFAFSAGAALATQAAVNSQLAAGMGGNPLAAAFFSFASAAVILAVLGNVNGGFAAAVAAIPSQPWWRLTGGVLGAWVLIVLVSLAPRIGIANLLALLVAGQLVTSLVIDDLGLLGAITRQASPIKLAGAAIMLAGVLLSLFGDRIVGAAARAQ